MAIVRTRFENEQHDTFSDFFTSIRSQNGFITTDRPDSSKLVDLHVYIIPKAVWKNVQHLAQNTAMEDAISAGFVRVPPEMDLSHLRQSIQTVCGREENFPREYIFLRSVGRCLTRVKPAQEVQLRVKNYRPPQVFAPEIFLLDGRHEDYLQNSTALPSVSPTVSPSKNGILNRQQHRSNHEKQNRLPLKATHKNQQSQTFIIKDNSNKKNGLTQRKSFSGRASSKFTQTGSEDSSPTASVMTTVSERDSERSSKKRQSIHRSPRSKKTSPDKENAERRLRLLQEENRRLQEKIEDENRRREAEDRAATRIQASFRGYKDRQAFRERQLAKLSNGNQISSNDVPIEETKIDVPDINENDLSNSYEIERRANEVRRRQQAAEDKRKAKEEEEQQHRQISVKRKSGDNVELLRARLEDLRVQSQKAQTNRDEIVKYVKYLHYRITARRKEARDMWKKKYYFEKKKTPYIEENCLKLKNDLEHLQQKAVHTIDNECKQLTQMGYIREAEIGNTILRIITIEHEIQELRRQLNHVKLRLTTDVKLRNQAETESRTIKNELRDAKMNLQYMKQFVRI